MALIKQGTFVDDPWITLDTVEETPRVEDLPQKPVIVPLSFWRTASQDLLTRSAPTGLLLRGGDDIKILEKQLDTFDVIAIEFPIFKDGRGFSLARMLREDMGYKGELRAVGEVLRDQFMFMHRCGFDAFEVKDQTSLKAWQEAMKEMTVWYQESDDGRPSVPALRSKKSQQSKDS